MHLPALRNFYPRPPRGGRPGELADAGHAGHFYPRPPRGGRHAQCLRKPLSDKISIHALREEGDNMGVTKMGTWHKISIHALREEGDMAVRAGCCCSTYFYPRPPRGGRHAERCDAPNRFKISIHALREEGDTLPSTVAMPWELFLSTPSARRATLNNSLHTDPLTENFYPRPPRGGRLDLVIGNTPFQLFLSTPSARRATR